MDKKIRVLKAISLIVANLIILYAAGRIIYVEGSGFLLDRQSALSFGGLAFSISTATFLLFSFSLTYLVESFPTLPKHTLVVKGGTFLENTQKIIVSILGITYFSMGVLGLIWQMYIWGAMVILLLVFLPFMFKDSKSVKD